MSEASAIRFRAGPPAPTMLDARGQVAAGDGRCDEITPSQTLDTTPADDPVPSPGAIRFRRTDLAAPMPAADEPAEQPQAMVPTEPAATQLFDDPDPRAELVSLEPALPTLEAEPELQAEPAIQVMPELQAAPEFQVTPGPAAAGGMEDEPGTSTGGFAPQERVFVRRDERTVQREQLRARAAELRAARAERARRIDRSSLRD